MSRSVQHLSGAVAWNGKGQYVIQAAATAAAATQRFGYFVAPCDGEIVAAGYNVDVDPSHATNNFSFGSVADIDSIIDEIDITDIGLGYHDLMGATQGVDGFDSITKGEVYAFGWESGDTDGHLTAFLVIDPRYADD